jgi:hypothetical protein
MRRKLQAAAAALAILSTPGCATLVRGDKQTVKVITDPPAATVLVDGTRYLSPAEVILKRKQPHDITLEKHGYQTVAFKLKSHWDAGGLIAVGFDAAVPGGSALFVIDWLFGADREFHNLATIHLPPSAAPTREPLILYEYKGKLLAKADYDAAIEKDKWFKSSKPKPQPQPADGNTALNASASSD